MAVCVKTFSYLLFVEFGNGLSEILDVRIFGDLRYDFPTIQMIGGNGVEIRTAVRFHLTNFSQRVFLREEKYKQ